MTNSFRTLTLTAALAVLATSGTARAQNTYQDFPFQQGSLFYRYNGQKKPQQTYRAPVTQYAAPATPVAPGYTANPGAAYYRQPGSSYTYSNNPVTGYRTYPVRRRGLFGRWRTAQ